MKTDIENDLVEGAADAAHILGITPRQVYHMVSQDRLPHTRIGSRLYFRRSELSRHFSADVQPTNLWSSLSSNAALSTVKKELLACLKA